MSDEKIQQTVSQRARPRDRKPERLRLSTEDDSSEAAQNKTDAAVVGAEIGQIRVLERLGQGGMGDVYVGFDEKLQRRVALKAVRSDRLDANAKAHLLQEARILSHLEDPKICRIYDYLETDYGDFLVLELVQGKTLTEIDTAKWSRREKLRVALQIAEALVVAHGQGVAHRDLKAANVMLTDDGMVKVLDFGIAKRTSTEEAPGDSHVSGFIIGTPGAMSPEQARSEPAGPASDLYSFGLLLHELFSTTPPHPSGLTTPDYLVRASRGETDPLHGVSSDLARLILRLESVEPELRPSAEQTVAALRLIRDKKKRVLRRLAVAAVAAAAMFGTIKYTVDLRAALGEAVEARAQAERSRTEAEEVSAFLTELFEVSSLDRSLGETISARELLDQGAERIQNDFRDQPELRAKFMQTIGDVYESLGLLSEAEEMLAGSVEILEQELSADPLLIARGRRQLGWLLRSRGLYEEAEQSFLSALEIQERELGPDHLEVGVSLNGLAALRRRQGRYEEAERDYLRSIEIKENALGSEDFEVSKTLNNLGLLYNYQGRFEEAEPLFRRVLKIKEAVLEEYHPSLARSLNNLANLLADTGRATEAEPLYLRSLSIWEQINPDHHAGVASVNNLGLLYLDMGRFEESEEYLRRAVDLRRRLLGEEHPDFAASLENLGSLFSTSGRYEEAEDLLHQAYQVHKTTLERGHPDIVSNLANVAHLECRRARWEAAQSLLKRSMPDPSALDDHPDSAHSLSLLAWTQWKLGRIEDAEAAIAQARSFLTDDRGTAHLHALVNEVSAGVAAAQGNLAEAAEFAEEAVRLYSGALPPGAPDLQRALAVRATLQGEPEIDDVSATVL